jgi:hypothetical protein
MKKRNYEALLDRLLFLVSSDTSGNPVNVDELLQQSKIESDPVEILVLAEKLVEDGHIKWVRLHKEVTYKDGKKENVPLPDRDHYHQCLSGIMFLESGGYQSKKRSEQRERTWTVVKIVAGVLNAATIIAIGVASVYFEFLTPQ